MGERIERIGTRQVRAITGLSMRRVQELSERGMIPSAARLGGGQWSYDEQAVRRWVKLEEGKLCRTTSTNEGASGTRGSRFEGGRYDEAYEQFLSQKPSDGSPRS